MSTEKRIAYSPTWSEATLSKVEALYETAADALDEMEAQWSVAKKQRELWSTHEKRLLTQRDAAYRALVHLRSAIDAMKKVDES